MVKLKVVEYKDRFEVIFGTEWTYAVPKPVTLEEVKARVEAWMKGLRPPKAEVPLSTQTLEEEVI